MRILIFISTLVSLQVSGQSKYYFSASGSDANSGTSPTSTWQTAGKFATTLTSASSGDSLLLKRGDIFSGYIITNISGGVKIGAFGIGADPIVSGFTNLTSWTETSTNSHLWEASCNSGNNLDLVQVNGVTIPAGRTPNYGSYYNIDSYTNSTNKTITSSSIDASTQNWQGAQVVARVNEYNLPREWISSHSGNTITFPSSDNPNPIDGANHKFFIQKHPATLDQPLEWYYNPSTHVLRMWSSVNPSTLGTVRAATQDVFYNVDYRGSIGFKGIKFIGIDSNVIMGRYPNNFIVDGCTFEDVGADAINLDTDSGFICKNSNFNRIANSGISNHYSTKVTINNNVVDSCGLVYGMSLNNNQQRDGICVEVYNISGQLGDSVTITNNTVTNIGYCGIRFTGTNGRVQYNTVERYGMVDSDGGGIYINGDFAIDNYRLITDNVIRFGHGAHDMYSTTGDHGMPAIYLDDQTGKVRVKNNSILGCTRAAIFGHNAENIEVSGNKIVTDFVDAAIQFVHDNGVSGSRPLTGLDMFNNFVFATATTNLFQYADYLSDYSAFGIIHDNYYVKPSGSNAFNLGGTQYTLATWQAAGYDARSNIILTPIDSVMISTNGSDVDLPIYLTSTYADLKTGAGYYRYVFVPAHGSLLLYRKTFETIKTGRPVKFIP